MAVIAVIGHVEHITLGRVPFAPRAGEIAHLQEVMRFPGGGGGIAFFQVAKSNAELHLFTAVGDDEAGAEVRQALGETRAALHIACRAAPHTRDVVMVTPEGERTIVVIGEPLHPTRADPLPWDDVLSRADAVYYTAQDPEILRAARRARFLIASARRKEAITRAGVVLDVIVGSASDPREASSRSDWTPPPRALVMTEGARGGRIETAAGAERFSAEPFDGIPVGSYGAGDSFAGALTYWLAQGRTLPSACAEAARYGRAVLAGLNPLEHQLPL